jgi:hypothetical protein
MPNADCEEVNRRLQKCSHLHTFIYPDHVYIHIQRGALLRHHPAMISVQLGWITETNTGHSELKIDMGLEWWTRAAGFKREWT